MGHVSPLCLSPAWRVLTEYRQHGLPAQLDLGFRETLSLMLSYMLVQLDGFGGFPSLPPHQNVILCGTSMYI